MKPLPYSILFAIPSALRFTSKNSPLGLFFLFLLFLLSCNTEPKPSMLKGSCQLGSTQTFVAPNGEYITATLKGPGYLHLIGNLNLAPIDVEASTELGDTIFPIEIWVLPQEAVLYEMCYEYEDAENFDFELAYWENDDF